MRYTNIFEPRYSRTLFGNLGLGLRLHRDRRLIEANRRKMSALEFPVPFGLHVGIRVVASTDELHVAINAMEREITAPARVAVVIEGYDMIVNKRARADLQAFAIEFAQRGMPGGTGLGTEMRDREFTVFRKQLD